MLGVGLGYLVRRASGEHDVVFLVSGSIAVGTLVTGVSGEIFDHTLYLIIDVLQVLMAALVGYYAPLVLDSGKGLESRGGAEAAAH